MKFDCALIKTAVKLHPLLFVLNIFATVILFEKHEYMQYNQPFYAMIVGLALAWIPGWRIRRERSIRLFKFIYRRKYVGKRNLDRQIYKAMHLPTSIFLSTTCFFSVLTVNNWLSDDEEIIFKDGEIIESFTWINPFDGDTHIYPMPAN